MQPENDRNVENSRCMFLIYGRKTSRRTKSVRWGRETCPHCGSYLFRIIWQRDYFHLFYLPVIPTGPSDVRTCCASCGSQETPKGLKGLHEKSMRTPFYLYTGIWLFLSLIFFLVLMNLHNQKLKKEYVANPEVGDIYRIRFKTDSAPAYYFLRINRISHDTVYTQANKFVYPKFVSNPDATDEFIKEPELPYTKEQLRQMLEQHEINGVDRNK